MQNLHLRDAVLSAFLCKKKRRATSASGFVTVWYDQSGNGLHAFQPVVASQPMIAKNGVMVLFNGK
ncbi:hypothetical protein, partial [Serratia fonticola]